MADDKLENLIRRVDKLEQKIETNTQNQNRVNQKTYDHVTALAGKVEKNTLNQNKVNQKAHDHITVMERRFQKLDQRTQKVEKTAPSDPRQQEKKLMGIVDQALREYDRKKGKKGR